MHRINMYRYDEAAGRRRLAGWYDYDAADLIAHEARDWDGANHVGRCSGLQTARQELLLTSGGRWVLRTNATGEHNGPDTHEPVGDQRVREWLLTNGHDALAAERFGPVADELPDLAALAEQLRQAEAALKAAIVDQVADGPKLPPGKVSESEAQRRTKLDRGTIRRWRGKPG